MSVKQIAYQSRIRLYIKGASPQSCKPAKVSSFKERAMGYGIIGTTVIIIIGELIIYWYSRNTVHQSNNATVSTNHVSGSRTHESGKRFYRRGYLIAHV